MWNRAYLQISKLKTEHANKGSTTQPEKRGRVYLSTYEQLSKFRILRKN